MPAPERSPRTSWLIAGVAAFVLLLSAGAFLWWQQTREEPKPESASPAPAAETPPVAATPAEPQVEQQIEQADPQPAHAPQATEPLPPPAQSDQLVRQTLTGQADRRAVPRILRLDDLIRNLVATIDNLPNAQAPVRLWPVNTTPGRFVVDGEGDNAVLSGSNFRRYAPFVQFVESVDTGKAVALYVELYPLFQRAYAELGYPDRHFNDRLIEVIDHLLETPEPTGAVQLFRPGVMYEYADPDLEMLSAGQKILIRTGGENAARLKVKLRAIREQLMRAAVKQ